MRAVVLAMAIVLAVAGCNAVQKEVKYTSECDCSDCSFKCSSNLGAEELTIEGR